MFHWQVFLPNEQHGPRSSTTIEQHANKAKEEKRPIFDIKGKRSLSCIQIQHQQFQWIACMLFWRVFHDDSCPFSLIQKIILVISIFDESLKKLINNYGTEPPQEFIRSPRSVSSFKQWKTSEFCARLLYYSLPDTIRYFTPRLHSPSVLAHFSNAYFYQVT